MNKTVLLLSLLLPAIGLAQPFSIQSHKISGGGGRSAGGSYAVSGTIGQPAAGITMTGGNYSVASGFWSFLVVVQTPGAPLLSLQLTPGNRVLLSWPAASSGFVVEQNSDLRSTNWVSLTNAVSVVGDWNQVELTAPPGARFYRLFQP